MLVPEPAWGLETSQLREDAERGDEDAAYFLGVMYHTGSGVTPDCRMALKWTEQAALKGHALAQSHLGRMYTDGCDEVVTTDPLKAYFWTALAAKQGLVFAEEHLVELEKQLHPYLVATARQEVESFKPEKGK